MNTRRYICISLGGAQLPEEAQRGAAGMTAGKNGVPAKVTVISVADTGVMVNTSHSCGSNLR
jgi:hypothetical protein